MNSREEILAAILKNTQIRYEKPDLNINATMYSDRIEQFCSISRAVGGDAIVLKEGEDINTVIKAHYPDAVRIASILPEITCATFNPDDLDRSQELNGTDVAIVSGEIGVAENGTVWIPQMVKHKALYFIAEKLVIVLDKHNLVNNMHEAYRRLEDEKYTFGVFISGPSKTADIEQALVMGAHGARDVLVILK